jgi:hypothetical protein
MPTAPWASKEQMLWLQEQLPAYLEYVKKGDYTDFWPILYDGWFRKYPKHAVLFPDIPENLLSQEQVSTVDDAKEAHQVVSVFLTWQNSAH